MPIELADFDLWAFLDRNSKLFVTLGIFGAFTLYLNSFKDIIDKNIINLGILTCLILIIVISGSILCNVYSDIKRREFPLYIIETGNLKRAGFVIPFIIFIGIITYTIISLFVSSDLIDILAILFFILGMVITLRIFTFLIIKGNLVKMYTSLLLMLLSGFIFLFLYNEKILALHNQFLPVFLLIFGISITAMMGLIIRLDEDIPKIYNEINKKWKSKKNQQLKMETRKK